MAQPTVATIKRLFAVSGNQCAFPGCTTPLVVDNVVTGEICHIKAQKPKGPRYDFAQSDKEHHSFDNLILLCGDHHKVIDTDPATYTVERLLQIKAEHEGRHAGDVEPADDIVQRLLATVRVQVGIGQTVVQFGDVSSSTINATFQRMRMDIPSSRSDGCPSHRSAGRTGSRCPQAVGRDGVLHPGGGGRVACRGVPIPGRPAGSPENLLQTLSSADRLLVLGEPGSGKTVSLERLIEGLQLWMKTHLRHPVVVTSRSQDELWRLLTAGCHQGVVCYH